MKLGLCTSFLNVHLAAELGFDYIECALNALAAMPEGEYEQLLADAVSFPIPVSKCNCLLPGEVVVVGPGADETVQRAYLEKAFSRARELGIDVAVFGSGRSRSVPEGWAFAEGWRQVASFLTLLAEYADKYAMTVAIEPLRRQECNLLNLVSEGTALAALTAHPRIGVLGDTFHMNASHEPYAALTHAGALLKHIHISHTLPDLSGRIYPADGDGEDYAALFAALKAADYQGDVSIEAGCKDLRTEGAAAFRCLKKLI